MKNDIASKLNVAILSIVLLAGFARAQTNLVNNGGFEAGPTGQGQFTAWGWLGPAGSFSDYGVAKSTAAFEVAEQGTNFAYFRGHPTDNSQDCLGTDVALKVGGLYNISYYLGTDGPLTNGAAMWVVIGTSFGISSVDTMLTAFFPNSASALPYQKFSTNYVPTTTGQILSFHGINATNGIAVTNGILLDNVSVVLAYPPLNINRSGPGSLVFTWPFTNTVYRLQTNASLLSTNWGTLSNVPTAAGATNQVILPAPVGTLFYRLTLP